MDFENPENVKKLENIFMPHKAKKKKLLTQTNNQFVHYTSAENAIKIINSKKLWLRSPKCMNDYMEISHGHQQLVTFFNTPEHKGKFIEALNLYEVGIADEVLNNFDEWWKQIQNQTYIASISVHPASEDKNGRLSMWRAYGEQSAKAALVLNNPPDPIKGFSLTLSPAAYFEYSDLESEILSVIANITQDIEFLNTLQRETVLGALTSALINLAVCLKHPGFKEEQEWRIIHLPTIPQLNNLIESSVETIGGVPQVVYKMPLEDYPELEVTGVSIPQLIDKVIIGPTQYPLALHDAFAVALTDAGVDDAGSKIILSDIPLRT